MALTVDQIASYYPNSLYQTGNIGFSEAEVTRYLTIYQNVDSASPAPAAPVNGTPVPLPLGWSRTPTTPPAGQNLYVISNLLERGVFYRFTFWGFPGSVAGSAVLNGVLDFVIIYRNFSADEFEAAFPDFPTTGLHTIVGGTPTTPPDGWSFTPVPPRADQTLYVASFRILVNGAFITFPAWSVLFGVQPGTELLLAFRNYVPGQQPTGLIPDAFPTPTAPDWELIPTAPRASETTYISVRPLMTDVGEFIPNSVWSTPQDITTIPDDLEGTASFRIVERENEIPNSPEVGDVIWFRSDILAPNGTNANFNFLGFETYRWGDQERWEVFQVPTTAFSQPSNIRKIISATHDAFYSTAQTYLNTLSSFIDFSGLEAEALNVFGEIWGVARPTFTTLNADVDINDELYRQLIHAVILSRFGGNTYSSLYILARAIELDRFIISINIEGGAVLDGTALLDASTRLLGVNALGQGSIQIRYSGVLPTANLQVRNFFATDSSTGKSRFSSFLSLLFEPILATGIDLDLRLEGT